MKQVEAAIAEVQLEELLDEVERGETIAITRHGKPIARIVPDPARRQEEIDAAIAGIKELRKHTKRTTVEEIIAWKNEGRH